MPERSPVRHWRCELLYLRQFCINLYVIYSLSVEALQRYRDVRNAESKLVEEIIRCCLAIVATPDLRMLLVNMDQSVVPGPGQGVPEHPVLPQLVYDRNTAYFAKLGMFLIEIIMNEFM